MQRKDSQYLGVIHPFRGLLCYLVEPQGLRAASEHGYEVLSRVYGDMVEQGRMTRMADSLFPVGNTYEEVLTNYTEVLRRAEVAGLTFNPKKVECCPTDTVLFGWRLCRGAWSPTEHTVSALSVTKTPPVSQDEDRVRVVQPHHPAHQLQL